MTPPLATTSSNSNISACETSLAPEEKWLNELSQMAIHGSYAPGVTAKDLAAAKRKIVVEQLDIGGGYYEPWRTGGESILHEAARSGHYPPDTTLELLAGTRDVTSRSALEIALLMYRDYGIPLPRCCTGPALAMLKPYCAHPTWLHLAFALGFTTPDTTPELLVNTVHDGWTALHAAAENGNLIPGITLRMLKGSVAPVTGSRVASYSALEAFKEPVDRALGWLSEGKSPLSKQIITSTRNLLRASVDSVPNLGSLGEVRQLAEVLRKIAPVETAFWVAAELVYHQKKQFNAVLAT